jgi:hypothetical protein
MEWDNGSEDSQSPEQWNVSAIPNVPRLIWPMRRRKKKVEKGLMTVNIMKTRRNKGIKKK